MIRSSVNTFVRKVFWKSHTTVIGNTAIRSALGTLFSFKCLIFNYGCCVKYFVLQVVL